MNITAVFEKFPTQESCIERLTSTIYILLDSGLPVVYTLEVSARSVGNTLIEENILQIKV